MLGLLNETDQYFEKLLTADNKIYVVVAVLSIILIGLFTYLFFTDKKISKLEKEVYDFVDQNSSTNKR